MDTIADRVGGKRRIIGGPFGSNLTQKDYVSHGVPVIRGTNMEHHGRWIGGEFVFVSDDKARNLKANVARPGDIVVTQRGTLGQVSIIPDDLGHALYIISQSQMAIAIDDECADPLFVYYFLRSQTFNEYVGNTTIQTGVPHINLGILRDAPAIWPSLSEQQEIAKVLGSLDDQIELNRRMNETLEAIAQAIFRDWFVDFGPTRRKLDGATDLVEIMGGLLPDGERARSLADLFPAKLGDAGLPEGWRDTTLGTVAKDFGGTIQTGPFGSQLHQSDYTVSGNPVVMPANLTYSGFREGDFSYVSSQTTERLSKHRLDLGDIVYGRRGDIGRKALIGKNNAGWLCGTGCLKLSFPSKAIPPEYLYYWLDQQNTVDWIRSRAIGATMPNLNTSTLGELPLLSPPYPTLLAFEEIVKDLLALQEENDQQNRTLAATRDLLLPQLMSGEICLAEAEGLLEAAQ
ncbi:restriction endonuclease subunit S [Rhizobium laguerreae]|uniref:restriction endonuclease subunit S n=1 Tax=Rhizobium laguerreae TaxID=1076926 RepID=UPI001C91F68C|nr:restriction endonuclease subunit S [Rhizobium laguerreae]MBY3211852.1 hypothetical protein [Rhizobium laguerreae]